jgi:hypothetical protein
VLQATRTLDSVIFGDLDTLRAAMTVSLRDVFSFPSLGILCQQQHPASAQVQSHSVSDGISSGAEWEIFKNPKASCGHEDALLGVFDSVPSALQ